MYAMILSALIATTGSPDGHPADELLREGRRLLKEGKAAEACPLLEQSQAIEPGLETLLALANCYDHAGRSVQAYLRFNEAVGWAHKNREQKREEAARSRAARIKSRLSWLAVSAEAPLPGMVVTVGEFQLPCPGRIESVPVDPGAVAVSAAAPGFKTWLTRVSLGQGQVKSLSIPALAAEGGLVLKEAAASLAARPSPPPLIDAPVPLLARVEPGPSVSGPVVAMAAGGTLLVAGAGGLFWSLRTYDQFMKQQPGGPDFAHPSVTQGQFKTLGWVYPASWGAVAAGALATASSGVWYWKSRPSAAVALVPSSQGAALAISGTF